MDDHRDGEVSGTDEMPSHLNSFTTRLAFTPEVEPAKADMRLLMAYVVAIALAGAVGLLIWAMAFAPGWSGDSEGSWVDAEQAPVSEVTVKWTDLRLGDCIQDVWADDNVVVPCSDWHSGEVILTDESFYAHDSAPPPEDEVTDREAAAAEAALQAYTGLPPDDGPYWYLVDGPYGEEWANGVRRIVVYGTTLDASDNEIETTGTMAADSGAESQTSSDLRTPPSPPQGRLLVRVHVRTYLP